MYNPICSRFVPARSQKILLCEEKNICRRTPPNLHEHISALCGLRIFFLQLEELHIFHKEKISFIKATLNLEYPGTYFCLLWPKHIFVHGRKKDFRLVEKRLFAES